LQDVLEERDFEALGLESWLVSACASVGMKRPTDVQWNCIPPVLEGRNVLASAETGSGKTAAFALPILQLLARDPYGIFALVLTPTRELAFQIQDQFAALGSKISLRFTTVVGGMDMMHQAVALCKRPHVVVATPGRLADHVRSSHGVADALRRTKFLVLDEADRMLEPTFERDMAAVLEVLPPKRTTLLFSATITASIEALKDMAFKDCFQFEAQRITTVTTVREKYCHVPAMVRPSPRRTAPRRPLPPPSPPPTRAPLQVKDAYLVHLVRSSPAKSLIVFAGTRAACQLVALLLGELGQEVAALHSDLRQARRLAALDTFKAGRARVLVATDVAGRGLDIPSVDLVRPRAPPPISLPY
jgi:ATP-dependent RNA helicase DDX49/DBP8